MANISKYPWMYLDRITPKDYSPADFERRRIEYLRRRRYLHPENEALVAADERRRTIYAESDVNLMRALNEGHRRKSESGNSLVFTSQAPCLLPTYSVPAHIFWVYLIRL